MRLKTNSVKLQKKFNVTSVNFNKFNFAVAMRGVTMVQAQITREIDLNVRKCRIFINPIAPCLSVEICQPVAL